MTAQLGTDELVVLSEALGTSGLSDCHLRTHVSPKNCHYRWIPSPAVWVGSTETTLFREERALGRSISRGRHIPPDVECDLAAITGSCCYEHQLRAGQGRVPVGPEGPRLGLLM